MFRFGRQNVPLLATVAAVVVAGFAGAGVVGLTSSDDAPRAANAEIVIATGSCAAEWRAPASGHPTFVVRNDSDHPYEVQLVDVDSRRTYGAIEVLAPHTQRPLRVALPPGRFQWQCGDLTGPATISATRTVTGAAVVVAFPTPPENETANTAAFVAYREEVATGLQQLATDAPGIAAAAGRNDRAGAQAAWLQSHLDYERLGAAYDTFGDFANKIEAGFHRTEGLLWSRAPLAAAVAPARALAADASALVAAFPTQTTGANDISLRAHEILENTLRFELTGETDNGSHTNLATARANVDGTAMVLTVLTPQLRRIDPDLLTRVTVQLRELGRELDTYRTGDQWRALSSLTRQQREQLNAATSALLESLSPVPDLLEVDPNAQP